MSATPAPAAGGAAAEALALVDAGVAAVRATELWSLSEAELLGLRAALERSYCALFAQRLRITREVGSRGAAVSAGASSTAAWLIAALREHPGEAVREVRLAETLAVDVPAAGEALAEGRITPAAATVIAETDRQLAATATAAQRADGAALLVAHAPALGIRGLEAAAMHLRNALDPGRGARLEDDEEHQVASREFRLTANPDGSCRPGGYLDAEATAVLRAALDARSAPRSGSGADRDRRSAAERRADALLDLVDEAMRGAAAAAPEPAAAGGPATQLAVTIDDRDLRADVRRVSRGTGLLDTGLPLSAAAVRRLACDCQVVPVVLGARGEPLDVGRSSRTVPNGLRRAVIARDGHCAFPGCDRPPSWCEVHHIVHWADGGPTALANSVLLCRHHHRAVHHRGWDVCLARDGLPEFRPPAWVDPERTARRGIRPHDLTALRPPEPPPRR